MQTISSAPPVNILLVDDQPVNLLALRVVLEGMGQNIVEAHSGEETLRRLLEQDFAVILLEVQMQGMDGYETAQLIRGRDRSRHTPIIFLIANENRFPIERAYALGVVDHLVKPVRPEILLCKVGIFVELFQKTQRVQELQRQEFDRKWAEDNPRLPEEQLRLSLRAGRLGFFEWDIATNVVTADATHRAMWGLEPDAALTADAIFKLIHPDDVERVKRDEQAALLEGHQEIEFRIVRPDGEVRWLDGHTEVVRNADGDAVKMVGLNMDITDRKNADEKGAVLNAQLTADLKDMTRLHDLSTRMVEASDLVVLLEEILNAAISITGADKGNVQLVEGAVLKIAVQRGFEAPFLNFFNKVHDGHAACGSAMQDGARVVVEDVTRSPIFVGTPALEVLLTANVRAIQSTPLFTRSGRVLGMFSTHFSAPHRFNERELRMLDLLARLAADLIENKQTEEALRGSELALRQSVDALQAKEKELELILSRTPILLTRCNRESHYVFVNRACAEFLGHPADAIIGRPIMEIAGEALPCVGQQYSPALPVEERFAEALFEGLDTQTDRCLRHAQQLRSAGETAQLGSLREGIQMWKLHIRWVAGVHDRHPTYHVVDGRGVKTYGEVIIAAAKPISCAYGMGQPSATVQIAQWVFLATEKANGQVWLKQKVLQRQRAAWRRCLVT